MCTLLLVHYTGMDCQTAHAGMDCHRKQGNRPHMSTLCEKLMFLRVCRKGLYFENSKSCAESMFNWQILAKRILVIFIQPEIHFCVLVRIFSWDTTTGLLYEANEEYLRVFFFSSL